MVELLLKKGTQVDSVDNIVKELLFRAAEKGHEAVVKLLLEQGADLESRDISFRQTPLSWAAKNGHEAMVKLLLEHGANLESKDNIYGRTPLLWAVNNRREAVVKLLLEKGA